MTSHQEINNEFHIPRRHFFRRFFAFLIDFSLLAVVSTIVVAALQPLTSTPLWAPSIFSNNRCSDITESHKSLVFPEFEIHENEKLFLRLCKVSNLGLLEQKVLQVGSVSVDGNHTRTRAIFYPVDDKFQRVQIFDASPFIWIICPMVFAMHNYSFGATLGKKLLQLRIVSPDIMGRNLKSLMKREYLRLFILILINLFTLIATYVFPNALSEFGTEMLNKNDYTMIYIMSAMNMILITPYIYNISIWKGKMFYDRITNLEVRDKYNFQ